MNGKLIESSSGSEITTVQLIIRCQLFMKTGDGHVLEGGTFEQGQDFAPAINEAILQAVQLYNIPNITLDMKIK
jgi:hypothetical protein